MALIKCYECEREISDRAKSCPHCGAPYGDNGDLKEDVLKENVVKSPTKRTNETTKIDIGRVLFILLFLIVFIILTWNWDIRIPVYIK